MANHLLYKCNKHWKRNKFEFKITTYGDDSVENVTMTQYNIKEADTQSVTPEL